MTAPRVLMVTARFFPQMGGIETHVYEVGRRLSGLGMSVTVLTTDLTGALMPEEEIDGLLVKRVRSGPPGMDLYLAPSLPQAIVAEHADIVHCQGVHTLTPPLAMATAARRNMPFVVTFHTGGHSSPVRTAARGLQWAALGPLFRRADRLIAVSEFEAADFSKRLALPMDRFDLIPNGGTLAPDEESGASEGEAEQAPLGFSFPSDGPLVLSIGRLERYKGHHRVLKAFSVVHQAMPDARLLIVGSGPEESRLRQAIKRANLESCAGVTSVPPGNRRQMAQLLKQATLVTLLSEYEAHPVAVMEALALGRPALVAYTSGLRELADKGWATAVPLDSSDEVVGRVMLEQVRHPRFPQRLELPTWDTCATRLYEVYDRVLSARGRARLRPLVVSGSRSVRLDP